MSSNFNRAEYTRAMTDLTFGEWLVDGYKGKGWTQKEFAEKLGVKNTTVSNWKQGVSPPSDENCVGIARLFGVTVNEARRRAGKVEVSGGNYVPDAGLSASGGLVLGGEADLEVVSNRSRPLQMELIPIIGTAAADSLKAFWGEGSYYPTVRGELRGIASPVMMVVSGDCMEPRINDGDLVILDTAATPEIGEVVAVRNGDDVTLKELWSVDDDEIVLRAIKAGYPPIRIAKSDQGAHLVGVVRRWIRSGRV